MARVGLFLVFLVCFQTYTVCSAQSYEEFDEFWGDYGSESINGSDTVEENYDDTGSKDIELLPTTTEESKQLDLETIPGLLTAIPLINNLSIELKKESDKISDNQIITDLTAQLVDETENVKAMLTGGFRNVLDSAQRILQSARTCQDLADIGFTESGSYSVDPDGFGTGYDAIMVHCNFTTNTTEIFHDQDSTVDIQKCGLLFQGNGCYKTSFEYSAPMSQIIALADLSTSCEQKIKFNCFLAPLREYGTNQLGFWMDRNFTQQNFFHGNGNANQSYGCQCGMNNQTCFESSLSCNCDAKVPEWLSDEGVISDKDLLPITEFAYGPLQYDLRQANIEIGNLKCSGSRVSVTDLGSCQDSEEVKAEIIEDTCNDARLENDHRLRIRLSYSNNKRCRTVLKLSKETTMTFSTDDHFYTESCCDYFAIYDGNRVTDSKQLKKYKGAIMPPMPDYEWSGDLATFYWHTDSSVTRSSMTVYIDF